MCSNVSTFHFSVNTEAKSAVVPLLNNAVQRKCDMTDRSFDRQNVRKFSVLITNFADDLN